jgi:flagellar biogenesis protein FliO
MRDVVQLLLFATPLVHVQAAAAELNAKMPLTQGDALAIPGIGRVVLVFLFISILSIGAAYLVKRYLPAIGRKSLGSESIKLIDRYAANAKLRMYLIEVDGKRVLVAEGASGLAMLTVESSSERVTREG